MTTPALIGIAVAELAAIIALGVLLIVSRRQLKGARQELERSRSTRSRRRRRGVAPLAIKAPSAPVTVTGAVRRPSGAMSGK
ncbi:MAG: hypothetical protein ACSLE6_14350 [Mycobacterium sp.]